MSKVGAVVTVKWLADQLASSSKNLRVLDGSWHLPSANRNEKEEYDREHIKEALFFDIRECCDKTAKYGVYMLPQAADFESYVGKLGINNDKHVVVYDTHEALPLFSAQRVWWMFRVFGHENVSVLEGGLRKWKDLNNPVTADVPQIKEEQFKARYVSSLVKSFEEIEANQSQNTFTLIDARPAAHFEGKAPNPKPGMKNGCIKGSLNLPFMNLMDMAQQTFKSKEEMQKMFEDLPVDISKPITGTCGSGIAACMIALAAFMCGNEKAAVYNGAWTEWHQRARPDQMLNVPDDPSPPPKQ